MSRPTRLAAAVAALGAAFLLAAEGGSPSEPGSNEERTLAAAIDNHAALGKARLLEGDLSGAERELVVIDSLCRTLCTPYVELHRHIVMYRHRLASAPPQVPPRP